mgnify:FL=1
MILIATALTLRGQIRRDLWWRRAFVNIVIGIGTIIVLVMSRSIATSTPQFVPLLYASVIVPMVICLLSLCGTRHIAASSNQLSDQASA